MDVLDQLELMTELHEPDLSYEFNTIGVFKDKRGDLYWGHTQGCSCPMPYEEFEKIEDFTVLNRKTFQEFENYVRNFGGANMAVERLRFIREVDDFITPPPTTRQVKAAIRSLQSIADSLG